jgi:subtilisin family serine protease
MNTTVPLIQANRLWKMGIEGENVLIGIVDTGIDLQHPDLADKIVAIKDFTRSGKQDRVGHGTAVASVIAGNGYASKGLYKGVAPKAKLVIAKALDNNGNGQLDWIIDACEWLASQGVKIINLSLGTTVPSDGTDPLCKEVNYLVEKKGIIVVAAAGNEDKQSYAIGSPGAAENAITVAATDKRDRPASFSSRGPTLDGRPKPDLAAPGVRIAAARASGTTMGQVINQYYVYVDGTSFAAPHVSGVCALLKQAFPNLSAKEIKEILKRGCDKIGLRSGCRKNKRIQKLCFSKASKNSKRTK